MEEYLGEGVKRKKYVKYLLLTIFVFASCAISKTQQMKAKQASYANQAEKFSTLYSSCQGSKCDSLLWRLANSQFMSEEMSCSLAVDIKVSGDCLHIRSRPEFWDLKRKYPESIYAPPTHIRLALIEDVNGRPDLAVQILTEYLKNWPNHEYAESARQYLKIQLEKPIVK